MNNTMTSCSGFDACIAGVIGGGGTLLFVSLVVAMVLVTTCLIVRKKRSRRSQCKKKTRPHELTKTGPGVGHREGDTYAMETEIGPTSESHDYTSIDMTGNQVTTFTTNLEKGGRYIQVPKQDSKRTHDEVNPPTPVVPQISVTDEAPGYDVPRRKLPRLSWGRKTKPVEDHGYDEPENAATPGGIKIERISSRESFNEDSKRDRGKKKQTAAYENNTPQSLKGSREVIVDAAKPSGQTLDDDPGYSSTVPRTKGPAKALNPMYRSTGEMGRKSPSQEPPDYANIDKNTGEVLQVPDSAVKIPGIGKSLKPIPRVKLKPPLPSKPFKSKGESPQTQEPVGGAVGGASRKFTLNFSPSTPNVREKKATKELPNVPRSKSLGSGGIVRLTPSQGAGNYTPIKIEEMDSSSDYVKV